MPKPAQKKRCYYQAVVITASDTRCKKISDDKSGPALCELLARNKWTLLPGVVLEDDEKKLAKAVAGFVRKRVPLIVVTGGTGIGPRDVTPEAVRSVIKKEIPGIAELMRARGLRQTKFAALSRSLAGMAGQSLIICVPGSPMGAVDSLQAVIDVLPHAVVMIYGGGH